jgi:hypothetical protein
MPWGKALNNIVETVFVYGTVIFSAAHNIKYALRGK